MEKHLSLHKEKGKGREERGGGNGLETREGRLYGKRTETRRGRKGDSERNGEILYGKKEEKTRGW